MFTLNVIAEMKNKIIRKVKKISFGFFAFDARRKYMIRTLFGPLYLIGITQ